MQEPITRNYAIAQAALEHAVYFLEIGASDRAATYFQFAAQNFQGIAKTLVEQEAWKARVQSQDLGTDEIIG
ncbi:MAG: hypothetical protein D6742_19690 [Cyanobacteria bacterium J069]|nr:MAG: hypothetical protein D6742_19690 [Cyanobacteria bacterium J069]